MHLGQLMVLSQSVRAFAQFSALLLHHVRVEAVPCVTSTDVNMHSCMALIQLLLNKPICMD